MPKKPRSPAQQARGFQPGVSGNPGGRPKSERTLLVAMYGEGGKTLHDQMDRILADAATPAHVKVDILKFKIERMFGKAPQAVQVSGDPEGVPIRTVIHQYMLEASSGPI